MAAADLPVPEGFVPARFAPGFLEVSGPYFVKREAGGTTIGCRVSNQHMNYVGVAHGGVLATLADVALSFVLYNSTKPAMPVSTVSMTTNFLGAAKLGDWVEAHAVIDRIGKRLAYAHGAIHSGDRLLMTMSGVYSIIAAPDGAPAAPAGKADQRF
jgi:acyl-coenzyme A thioesterase 13